MKKFLVIVSSSKSGICPFVTYVKDPSQIDLKVKKYLSIYLKDECPVWAEAYLFLDDASLAFYRAFSLDGGILKECRDYRPTNGCLMCVPRSESF